jgi:hypothetical protein
MLPPLGGLKFVLSRDGGRIRVFDSGGSGDVVLLAHGYLLDWMIRGLVVAPLIAAGYRVLAFEISRAFRCASNVPHVGLEPTTRIQRPKLYVAERAHVS